MELCVLACTKMCVCGAWVCGHIFKYLLHVSLFWQLGMYIKWPFRLVEKKPAAYSCPFFYCVRHIISSSSFIVSWHLAVRLLRGQVISGLSVAWKDFYSYPFLFRFFFYISKLCDTVLPKIQPSCNLLLSNPAVSVLVCKEAAGWN